MYAHLSLADKLRRGDVLLLDGAMGTVLELHGVPTNGPLWSAAALTSHPELVAEIHKSYVEAGADIIVANTFRTNAHTLRRVDRLADGPELNRLAVALARDAAGPDTIVAASLAPMDDCYRPDLVPDADVLAREHGQTARWLADAEPDVVWIETMGTIREAVAAADAVCAVDLPFVVSFVTRESGELLGGEALEDTVATIAALGPLAIGVNCVPPRGITAIVPRLAACTTLPIAAYAHINNQRPTPGWSYTEAPNPHEYALAAREWIAAGARIVGGCCGTTPGYIDMLRRMVK